MQGLKFCYERFRLSGLINYTRRDASGGCDLTLATQGNIFCPIYLDLVYRISWSSHQPLCRNTPLFRQSWPQMCTAAFSLLVLCLPSQVVMKPMEDRWLTLCTDRPSPRRRWSLHRQNDAESACNATTLLGTQLWSTND